ncbi:hypothetical protein HK414_27130 [Ramlibacter terrae]|uniref:Filamentous hemagglutinin n=1 Tax=Ramlibacter terrae TaxID=2732511 RepID=A0ABX6P7A0_9BURK|nr:hypothetical protein HK414_27130 [Ramlibacter terrae]
MLGERVGLMAGTRIEANGGTGGGSIRIGGDYQGANADVQNAARTYVDGKARIEADATRNGDGGRVIVWSDELTRFGGSISARGGKAGGDGGFAEVSGKQQLQYAGRADLRAPKGAVGTLLLDPLDVNIVDDGDGSTNMNNSSVSGGQQFSYNGNEPGTITESDLNSALATANVQVTTSASVSSANGGLITLESGASINWNNGNKLWLQADAGIVLDGTINATASPSSASPGGSLYLTTVAGNITQSAGSTIKVANLYGSTGSTGGLDLTAGTNNVRVVAGAAGSGGFKITNAESLTIGSVTDGTGRARAAAASRPAAAPSRSRRAAVSRSRTAATSPPGPSCWSPPAPAT